MSSVPPPIPPPVPFGSAAADPELHHQNPSRHRVWLQDRAASLLDGFETVDIGREPKLYRTARLVFGFSAAAAMNRPGAGSIVDAGMARLRAGFRDTIHGGFVSELGSDGAIAIDRKECYGHAFVLLAAAGACAIDHPDAPALLAEILQVLEERFWDPDRGAARESFSRDWRDEEPYRGQNANMHLTEACLAAFEVTGETIHLERAERIATLIVDRHARDEGWRIVEHFTSDWLIDRTYEGSPEFRPRGTTPGHSFEWSRLLLQLWILGGRTRSWLPEAAAALFRRAWSDAWRSDGGIAYTIDWNGRVDRRERLSWPCCEAIGAAACLLASNVAGGDWADHYRTIWEFTARRFIDPVSGAWFQRLPETGSGRILPDDRPDLYHALQACLLPIIPVGSGLVVGLSRPPDLIGKEHPLEPS